MARSEPEEGAGAPGDATLTDQQAWDVAAWIDSQERPKDPRQKGSVADNAKAFHNKEQSFYGKTVDGHLLGTGTPPAH